MSRRLAGCLLLLLALPLQAAPLQLDGELAARESAALMPPSIDDLWQLNITLLVPEGTPVKQGMPVVGFDGASLQQRLQEKQAQLNEKRTQQQQLQLQLAERERSERLATEQARAARDKAQRKAEQPAELVRRVDYQKLVVEREQSERKYQLALRREQLAAEQRLQERRLLDAQSGQLQREVDALQTAMAALTLTAPRDGVMLHKSNWQGEKFEVGSQTWRGQAVAEIPDLATLEVRAQLPEPEFQRVRAGQPVLVRVDGSGQRLDGRVADIGRAVRSKSRLQPVPVVDLRIELAGSLKGLKPGQAVRVEVSDES